MRIAWSLVAALFGATLCFGAEVYPSRPVHVIVAFAPGGPDDISARVVSQQLAEQMGKSFVVENRTGASGAIAFGYVAKAAPDGYTLALVNTGWPATPLLSKSVPYDVVRDFTPITQLTRVPMVLAINPSLKANTLREFIALAQAEPGRLNFGSAGTGSTIHLAEELFSKQAKVKLAHVAYRGGAAEILSAVISGEVQMFMATLPSVLPQIKAGRVRALAVTTDGKRSSTLPDVPSMSEAGVPGMTIDNWTGLAAPAGTPREIVARLYAEVLKALALPSVKDQLQGAEVVGSSPEELAAFTRSEILRWSEVIKSAGITPE